MTYTEYLASAGILSAALALAPGVAEPFAPYRQVERFLEYIDQSPPPEPGSFAGRSGSIAALLGDDELALCALDLALGELLVPSFGDFLGASFGDEGVTLSNALRVYGRPVSQDPAAARLSFERLCLLLRRERSDEPFFRQRLRADERLLGYLEGDSAPDPRLAGLLDLDENEPAPLLAGLEALAETVEALEQLGGRAGLLHISGRPGCGRRLLLRHAARKTGCRFMFIDSRALCERPRGERAELAESLRREALLRGSGVCFYDFTLPPDCAPSLSADGADPADPSEAPRRFIKEFLEPLWQVGVPTAVCSEPEAHFLPYADRPMRKIELSPYSRSERIALWQGFCAAAGVELDCVAFGSRYNLSPLEIGKAVRRLAEQCPDGRPTEELAARICDQILPPPAAGSVHRIDVAVTLEDVKLPPEQKQKLRKICDHVLYSHRVYDEWGLESRYPYGRNVSALFVGPSGTGKTMAAHALSALLNLPLYRIDLSQVVDKYIGETEKRLEAIFTAAEKSNTILFFDEADAIFGKRSEVTEARDRYANTEVSFILQRMEQYEGIVVLASNFKKNIDEAFMRRVRYVVEFPMPDAGLREQIWRACFTAGVPLEGIDYPYLARQFELSGGSIKNIALNAAFCAAGQNRPVTMRDIFDALRDENLKMGKSMLKQDFAEYGRLI